MKSSFYDLCHILAGIVTLLFAVVFALLPKKRQLKEIVKNRQKWPHINGPYNSKKRELFAELKNFL